MIQLRKMNSTEFESYMKSAVTKYAAEKKKGEGLTEAVARKVAEDSYSKLLPDGLDSKDQFLFSVIETSSQEPVGILWFAKKMNGDRPHAFIYDVELIPEKRGLGFGKLLMSLVEKEALNQGCASIGLHVFGHNTAAVALYKKSGYQTTSRMMKKELTRE